jgi:Na+-driven multidrug efflux pump
MSEAPIPPAPAESKASGLSIASLICGIASVVCFGILAGIPAIVTGHLAMGKVKRGEAGGRGLALAGLIMGYISIALTILFILMGGLAAFFGTAEPVGPTP